MKVLKFQLSGKTAFFKKPDVNTYLYFTYGNIHKVSLLGILGAIMGYKGYNSQCNKLYKEKKEISIYPEFYNKLKHIKVGIVPLTNKGYILKKVQTFNNSVGYASKEQGGNLIVKEQWLENPIWDIYIIIEDEITEELANQIKNCCFKYIPYLGKNDHLANINKVEILENIEEIKDVEKIDSLFIKKHFHLDLEEDDDDEEAEEIWKYEENLPIGLEENTNKYELETFNMTNTYAQKILSENNENLICRIHNKNIFFF
ncbi:type I-B CRISPR-associated protein Cas5 [Clostridiaceae bacterium 14S0207]|nr:type I-B CRISPR-associated protein Cas5 [Clostridiaceae bacterium 14S0207]